MTCLTRITQRGGALFEQSTHSGAVAAGLSPQWSVFIYTDVPTAGTQAQGFEQSVHRLRNATGFSAAHDPDLDFDERLRRLTDPFLVMSEVQPMEE